MDSMARDMRHPYIPSTTVLGDMRMHNIQRFSVTHAHTAGVCIYACAYFADHLKTVRAFSTDIGNIVAIVVPSIADIPL